MPIDTSKCEGCPFKAHDYPMVSARGNPDGKYLVVTDIPSKAAAKQDRLLTPHQMGLLAEKLEGAGFEKDDFRFVPACYCAFDETEHVKKVQTAAIKHCRIHLLDEIEAGRSELVIPLGATATSQVFGRSTKITKVRGFISQVEELGLPVFPLTSPATVVAYPQNEPIMDADIASLARSVNANYDLHRASAEQIGKYEIVDDLQFLIDMDPEVISFDTETTGLRWYETGVDVRSYDPKAHKGTTFFKPRFQILTMQFSVEPGKGYMLVWDHPEAPIPEGRKSKIRNQLRQLLCKEDRIVVGQNAKYDNVALWMTEGIRYRISGDTLLLATLVDENMPERNLDILTKIYAPQMGGYADVFNATYDKSRMWEIPLADLLNYGVGDTDAALQVYMALEQIVAEDHKLWNHYCRVTLPGLNAFAGMETRGMYIDDRVALPDFKELMIHEVGEKRKELLRMIPRQTKQAIVHDYLTATDDKGRLKNKGKTVEDALSFSRPEFLRQLLFTHPQGFRLKPRMFTDSTKDLKDTTLRQPSTSAKDHLPFFFEECPFTERLADYIKDESLLTKSVISFEKNYIRGGKVRPTYSLHRTVTGRSSSEDPNGQNYPKRGERAKAYRKMFVPPPGYFVIEADLSQAELRIAAAMSGDKTMIDIYRSGGDIHRATGAIVAGLTMEQFDKLEKAKQKDYRQKAKAVNFGFLYGMGWRKFIVYAKTQYNVEFTDDEAKRVRSQFFKKYRYLPVWHTAMREFAQEHKFVRSFSGRIRHLPMIDSPEEYIQQEAQRQAINSPVQEFGSSLGVMALGRMNEELDPAYIQVVGFIHDAIVVYVKKEYVEWGMKTLKRYMQTNPLKEWFDLEMPVPIVADVGFGEDLGNIVECEGFSLDKPYDFTSLKDKNGNLLIEVPKQRTPPNGGRLCRSAYTTPEDREDEDTVVESRRVRRIRAVVSKEANRRMTRSRKQMVINRRNAEQKGVKRYVKRTRATNQS